MARPRKDRPNGLYVSRATWTAVLKERALQNGFPSALLPDLVRSQYPKATVEAVHECRARGLAATEQHAMKYAKTFMTPAGAGIYQWQADDIDDYCQKLAVAKRFLPVAIEAAAHGWNERGILEASLVQNIPRNLGAHFKDTKQCRSAEILSN